MKKKSYRAEQKECSMCGDVGFSEELFQCQKCMFRLQHRYCSSLYPNNIISGRLLCEWCLREEMIASKASRRIGRMSCSPTTTPVKDSKTCRTGPSVSVMVNDHNYCKGSTPNPAHRNLVAARKGQYKDIYMSHRNEVELKPSGPTKLVAGYNTSKCMKFQGKNAKNICGKNITRRYRFLAEV